MISKSKFLAGREVVTQLVKNFETMSGSNARKILQRASDKGLIESSKPITFGKGQFIYMLPGETPDLAAIKAICKKYRPPLYRILDALDDNCHLKIQLLCDWFLDRG